MQDAKQILTDAAHRMDVTLDALHRELLPLRAGKAHTGLVDVIKVHAYDSDMPLNQLATITTPDAQTILISAYDKGVLGAIEKAIQKSELGLNPQNDGSLIRLNVPPPTEQRRKELVKAVHHIGEESKIALRNVRRDANDHLKKMQKDKLLSEDELHYHLEQVDKLLEKHLGELDKTIASKDKEISEI
jgi:ribosome recycling factor